MWNYEKDYREKITKYMEDLVNRDGYPLEKYSVITADGYVNIMYRIPHGKFRKNNENPRPAVLLNHGMICSCATFVDQNALGYYLADNGFDVWLPNNRGTTFSTEHKDYNSDEEKEQYWDFSFHEIALYDLTAFIDFVLNKTGQAQICHIGFSQGVTTFVIMAAEFPEYNKKINLSIFLACPVVFNNVSSFPVKFNGYLITGLFLLIEKIFRCKLLEVPVMKDLRYIMSFAAPNTFCRKFIDLISRSVVGYKDFDQLSELDYQRMSLTTPNSSSMRQLIHFAQLLKSSRFAKYDYGKAKNMELYGTKLPPLYDMSRVTAPVAIFYGKNDMYNNHSEDRIETLLGNVVHIKIVEHELYNHLDFLYAKDNINLVYKHILKLMNRYCSNDISKQKIKIFD